MFRLHELFERSRDAVIGIDARRRVRLWNAGCERIFGCGHDAALGKTCDELVCGTDLDGSRLCGPRCSVPGRAARGEPPADFDLVAEGAGGRSHLLNVGVHHVPEELRSTAEGICTVMCFREIDCRRLVRRLASGHSESSSPAPEGRLSAREIEVLRLAAGGLTNAGIGGRLGICESTVKNHFKRIFHRLGVRSRAEAVSWASRRGLL